MTELKFRNIDVSPDDPVELWGVEGILACLERCHLKYWRKLMTALSEDTSGLVKENTRVALQLLERPNGVSAVFSRVTGTLPA
jgi:hypothetical protein